MTPEPDFARVCSTHGVSISEGIATAVLALDQTQQPKVRNVAELLYGREQMEKLNEGRFVWNEQKGVQIKWQ